MSSGRVKADCAGPRRAAITTSVTFDRRSAASAWPEMSVRASASGSVVKIRATSNATLPLPTITTRSWPKSTGRSVYSGCPLIHATISVAVPVPGSPMPSMSSLRSFGAPTA